MFGLYMGYLVFFLNPQIQLTAGRAALVAGTFSVVWGLMLGTTLWLLRVVRVKVFGRTPEDYRLHGFGYMVAASWISAVLFWGHLAFFRVFLPPGAVRILSKSTIALGIASFLLLILWVMERQIDRRVPNGALFIAGTIILLSILILHYRRDQYLEPTPAFTATAIAPNPRGRVTVVSVGDLPYDWVVTLAGEDDVPFLSRALDRGFLARVHPFNTSSHQALWASLATGKLPNRHRVTGRFSYQTLLNRGDPWLNLPRGVGFTYWGLIPPVEKISAPLPAGSALSVWAMFTGVGATTVVSNWPSTHGRLDTSTFGISDRACREETAATDEATRLALARACNRSRVFDSSLQLRLDALGDRPSELLASAIAADRAAISTALDVAEANEASLVTLSINSLRGAVRQLGIRDNELPGAGTIDGDVIRAVSSEIDRILEDVDNRFADDTLLIVSPSGPFPPPLPSNPVSAIRELLASEVTPGTEDGFVLILGEVKASRASSSIVAAPDVVPTILFAAGMPVARDLDGRAITEAFTGTPLARRGVTYIQTYERSEPAD